MENAVFYSTWQALTPPHHKLESVVQVSAELAARGLAGWQSIFESLRLHIKPGVDRRRGALHRAPRVSRAQPGAVPADGGIRRRRACSCCARHTHARCAAVSGTRAHCKLARVIHCALRSLVACLRASVRTSYRLLAVQPKLKEPRKLGV